MFMFLLRLFGFRSAPKRHPQGQDIRAERSRSDVPSRDVRISTPPPAIPAPTHHQAGGVLQGRCYVIDGDTIVIKGTHIRLAGIDAPELGDPWGKSAKFAMAALCKGQVITAHITEGVTYDRIVAKCLLPDGTDVSAKLVEQGLALDWAKFSGGTYRHLEPRGVRKKLWRVAAKHQGRLKIYDKTGA